MVINDVGPCRVFRKCLKDAKLASRLYVVLVQHIQLWSFFNKLWKSCSFFCLTGDISLFDECLFIFEILFIYVFERSHIRKLYRYSFCNFIKMSLSLLYFVAGKVSMMLRLSGISLTMVRWWIVEWTMMRWVSGS